MRTGREKARPDPGWRRTIARTAIQPPDRPLRTLDVAAARRLALARAGLAPLRWSGLPGRAGRGDAAQRAAADAVVGRFGYLQLDTISVAGARTHGLVLLSRLRGFDPALAERLLVPGAPLAEYWGHEASWIPIDLWPLMEFRREAYRRHPRWGPRVNGSGGAADLLLRRARDDGPFRSSDLEGARRPGWWGGKDTKRAAEALWRAGELAIRERRGFQRIYDLTERVIPGDVRARSVPVHDAFRALILLALDGHGWADAGTIAATFRLRRTREPFVAALRSLAEDGSVLPCSLAAGDGRPPRPGWIRPRDLDLAARLARWRPRDDVGVLLSPFDPVLWDRARVRLLFGFDQVFEAYVPPAKRRYGYFCLPVLAGERLVARADLKADRDAGVLRVLSLHYETTDRRGRPPAADAEAARTAIERHADAVGLARTTVPSSTSQPTRLSRAPGPA